MTCIICHTAYSVINVIMGDAGLLFYPHHGMCSSCHDRWQKTPEAKAALDAFVKYRDELKAIVQRHREKCELTSATSVTSATSR